MSTSLCRAYCHLTDCIINSAQTLRLRSAVTGSSKYIYRIYFMASNYFKRVKDNEILNSVLTIRIGKYCEKIYAYRRPDLALTI